MLKRYGYQHQIDTFVGDIASIHITREDRHGTDDRRLYCLVLRKPHPNRHAVLTAYGLLGRHYPTRQLQQDPDTSDTPNVQTLKAFAFTVLSWNGQILLCTISR